MVENIRGDYLIGAEDDFDGYVNGHKWDVLDLDLGGMDGLNIADEEKNWLTGNGMRMIGKPRPSGLAIQIERRVQGGLIEPNSSSFDRLGRTVLEGHRSWQEETRGKETTGTELIAPGFDSGERQGEDRGDASKAIDCYKIERIGQADGRRTEQAGRTSRSSGEANVADPNAEEDADGWLCGVIDQETGRGLSNGRDYNFYLDGFSTPYRHHSANLYHEHPDDQDDRKHDDSTCRTSPPANLVEA